MKIMYLDVHFDNCLADHCGTKKRPKRNKEMSTCNAGEIEQRIRYLYTTFAHERQAVAANSLFTKRLAAARLYLGHMEAIWVWLLCCW